MTSTIISKNGAVVPARKPEPAHRRKANHVATYIFIALMLLYPVAHFCLMWFGVNINSILLTFQTPVKGKLVYVMSTWHGDGSTFFSTLFKNFIDRKSVV